MDSDWLILGHMPASEPVTVVKELEYSGLSMPGSNALPQDWEVQPALNL